MTRASPHIVFAGPTRRRNGDAGYAMAVLLVGLAIMSVLLTVAMPVWHQTAQREKEEELIFRGNQYARAVGLFQRKYAGGYPPSIDALVQQKFLRKKYKDPMVPDGEFQIIPSGAAQAGQVGVTNPATTPPLGQTSFQGAGTSRTSQTVVGGMIGVVSKSKDKSIKLYNGRDHYNEWLFTYTAQGRSPLAPGGRGGRGQGPGQGGRGPGGFGPGPGGLGPTQFPPPGRGRGSGGQ